MIFNFEYKGISVSTSVSENNGEYSPMVMIMSYVELTSDEKREVRDMYQAKI